MCIDFMIDMLYVKASVVFNSIVKFDYFFYVTSKLAIEITKSLFSLGNIEGCMQLMF